MAAQPTSRQRWKRLRKMDIDLCLRQKGISPGGRGEDSWTKLLKRYGNDWRVADPANVSFAATANVFYLHYELRNKSVLQSGYELGIDSDVNRCVPLEVFTRRLRHCPKTPIMDRFAGPNFIIFSGTGVQAMSRHRSEWKTRPKYAR
jgi:hypothetical protein